MEVFIKKRWEIFIKIVHKKRKNFFFKKVVRLET